MTQHIVVLVVEDDPITLELTTVALNHAGYATISARSGEEALSLIETQGDEFDWLLTDISLGGFVTGYTVGAAFQLRYPQRPVVYTSAAPFWTPPLPSRSVCLPKPYVPLTVVEQFKALSRRIHEAEATKLRERMDAGLSGSPPKMEQPKERSSPRRRSMLRGQIIFNNRFSTVDCVVRDMSETGARLELAGNAALPKVFELYFPLRQKRLQAELVWAREGTCGVRFVG